MCHLGKDTRQGMSADVFLNELEKTGEPIISFKHWAMKAKNKIIFISNVTKE